MVGRMRGKPEFAEQQEFDLSGESKPMNNGHQTNSNANNNTDGLDNLIEEYNDFHSRWVQRVKQISSARDNQMCTDQ